MGRFHCSMQTVDQRARRGTRQDVRRARVVRRVGEGAWPRLNCCGGRAIRCGGGARVGDGALVGTVREQENPPGQATLGDGCGHGPRSDRACAPASRGRITGSRPGRRPPGVRSVPFDALVEDTQRARRAGEAAQAASTSMSRTWPWASWWFGPGWPPDCRAPGLSPQEQLACRRSGSRRSPYCGHDGQRDAGDMPGTAISRRTSSRASCASSRSIRASLTPPEGEGGLGRRSGRSGARGMCGGHRGCRAAGG